ncbi:C40 family peptidase [Streptomyces sp. NPDC088354]|uniref:C40 family peptidase n=1 Tax=Streptomyces sp. NPDC088354 TaxID=3365856 RepID=UPI003827D130
MAAAVGALALLCWPMVSAGQAAPVRTVAAAGGCDVLAPGASATAVAAVQAACGQIGVWYTWGGGHGSTPGATYGQIDPTDPDSDDDPNRLGFDCSGLVRYAYAQATGQDMLNGTAATQYYTAHAAQRFTPAQGAAPLLPGDLLTWGTPSTVHHVAIYLGAGKMVEARESGTHIMVSDVRWAGDYLGAVRVNGGPVTEPTFRTWGTAVWTHSAASTTSPRVYAFPGPTTVRISCQKHAETVTAEGWTNDAWSYLPDYRAWVTNIYIQGPAWLNGVPACA